MADDGTDIVSVLKQFTQPAAQPAPAGVNPDDYTQATSMMQMKYGPQATDMYAQYKTIDQTLQSDTTAQQQYGQIADQKMAGIANTLHGQLQQSADTTGQIFQAGQQKVGGIYDELLSSLGKAGTEVQDILTKQASRTGQDESLSKFSNPLGRIQGGIAEMQARAGLAKGNSVANLVTLGAQMQSIGQERVSGSDQEYAAKRANLATQIAANITKLQLTAMQDQNKVLTQFTQMAGTKAADLQQTILSLGNARTKNELAAAKLQLDTQYKQATLALKANAAIAKTDPNSLDNQLKQASLDKLNREAGTQPITYISQAQGMSNLNSFLNGIRRQTPAGKPLSEQEKQSGAITGSQVGAIQRFVAGNMSTAMASGLYSVDPGSALAGIAQKMADNKGMVDLGKDYKGAGDTGGYTYKVPLQTLLEAISQATKNVGPASKVGAVVPGATSSALANINVGVS